MSGTDAALAQRAVTGDRRALHRLLERHHGTAEQPATPTGEYAFVKIRYKLPGEDKVFFKCPDCGLARHDRDAVHCKACGRRLNIPDEGAVQAARNRFTALH